MEKKTQSAAYERGLNLLETLHGGQAGEQMVKELEDICPGFVNMTLEWALAGIMGRSGLDLLTRELLLIASCTTLGGSAAPQLQAHIDIYEDHHRRRCRTGQIIKVW
jgi:4-carboxymuconolactone decarboxylase